MVQAISALFHKALIFTVSLVITGSKLIFSIRRCVSFSVTSILHVKLYLGCQMSDLGLVRQKMASVAWGGRPSTIAALISTSATSVMKSFVNKH